MAIGIGVLHISTRAVPNLAVLLILYEPAPLMSE